MFIYLHKKGQSTLEYGIIIAVVVAALIAMQTYLKRGVQGRLKQASDDIGEQYSPGYTTGTAEVLSCVNSVENVSGGTNATTFTETNQVQNRTVNENTNALNTEYWVGEDTTTQ